jgi:hypothetical protein
MASSVSPARSLLVASIVAASRNPHAATRSPALARALLAHEDRRAPDLSSRSDVLGGHGATRPRASEVKTNVTARRVTAGRSEAR